MTKRKFNKGDVVEICTQPRRKNVSATDWYELPRPVRRNAIVSDYRAVAYRYSIDYGFEYQVFPFIQGIDEYAAFWVKEADICRKVEPQK